MLAVLHARQGHCGVHKIGNTDSACIDVLSFLIQHHAEIAIERKFLKSLHVRRGAVQVDIAQRHNIFSAGSIVQVHAALPSAADRRDIQLIVKRFIA